MRAPSCGSCQHPCGSGKEKFGLHMRTWPPAETTTRKQVTVPPDAAQSVTGSIEKSILTGVAVVGRPNPLNTMLEALLLTNNPVGSFVASRFRTMSGDTVSDGATPHKFFAVVAGS